MIKNAIWLFSICALILIFFLPSFSQMQQLKQKNANYRRQIDELKVKNFQMKEEQRLLQHDPMYLEKVAREKMGLVKEGEVVYRMLPVNGTK